MFEALNDAIDELAAGDELRAVVLSGEGPSFCAGLDVKSFVADGRPDLVGLAGATREPPNFAQKVAYGWRQLAGAGDRRPPRRLLRRRPADRARRRHPASPPPTRACR